MRKISLKLEPKMQQPESDESQFVKDINEQKLLLTQIKQPGNKDVSKIKQLIQSIISASRNYEYIWYFENNLVILNHIFFIIKI